MASYQDLRDSQGSANQSAVQALFNKQNAISVTTYQDIRDAQGTAYSDAAQTAYSNYLTAQPLSPGTTGGVTGGSSGASGGNSGSGSATTAAASTVTTTPDVKIATSNIILFQSEAMPVEIMADLLFEDIGGQEIISIARNDIVNGQDIKYSPIKNTNKLFLQYNPQNILSLQGTAYSNFRSYPIDLLSHVPEVANGPDGENVYINSSGDLVIDIINLLPDEQVEIQIVNSGQALNDTIYLG
jgi:hypothetical protein